MVAVLVLCFACDQATKILARNYLVTPEPVFLIGKTVQLHYHENSGAFLGFGAGLPGPVRFWLFTVGAGVLLIAVLGLIWFARDLSRISIIAGSLIIGGGFSNLIDRIRFNGAVSDFIRLSAGGWSTGIFNAADFAITLGPYC